MTTTRLGVVGCEEGARLSVEVSLAGAAYATIVFEVLVQHDFEVGDSQPDARFSLVRLFSSMS